MSVRRGKEGPPILSRRVFLVPAAFVLFFDQLTKVLAHLFLEPGESHPILPRIFHLTLVENQGIAFGLLQGRETVLLAVISVSIVVLILVGLRTPPEQLRSQWGIGLILGGAVGNWIDRIRLGAVVDFLDFRIWPVFNFADTAITIGVGLFLLELMRKRDS